MAGTEPITGAEFFARSLAANGTTHVFFIDAVLRRTLIELGTLGVTRVLGHSEKAVAYMADGYARIAGRPAVCFAQSVGAANLASGLQDAYLANTPVIAFTGRKQPSMQHRNAYQEVPHQPMFSSVTKFSAFVDSAAEMPRLMRQAWREAMTGAPGPAHLDLNGLQADAIETGMVAEVPSRRAGLPVVHAAASSGAVRQRHRRRGGHVTRGEEDRHRRRHRRGAVRRGKRVARAGRGAATRRSRPRLAGAGSFRHGTVCRLVAPETMPRRPRTRSCTRLNLCCSSVAIPAIRSLIPGGFRRSIRHACKSTSIRGNSAGPIPTRLA